MGRGCSKLVADEGIIHIFDGHESGVVWIGGVGNPSASPCPGHLARPTTRLSTRVSHLGILVNLVGLDIFLGGLPLASLLRFCLCFRFRLRLRFCLPRSTCLCLRRSFCLGFCCCWFLEGSTLPRSLRGRRRGLLGESVPSCARRVTSGDL